MKTQGLQEALGEYFTQEEVRQMAVFLERDGGFCPRGEFAVAEIFGIAKEHGRHLPEVLSALEAEWESNWRHQPVVTRGDPNSIDGIGVQNLASVERIYRALNILNPNPSKQIPSGCINVKTVGAMYLVLQANEKGERSIIDTSNNIQLFSNCIVVLLTIGRPMEVVVPGCEGVGQTNVVESITII